MGKVKELKFTIIEAINDYIDEDEDWIAEEVVEHVTSTIKGVREEDVWEVLKYDFDVETEDDYYAQLNRENPRG